MPEIGCSSIGVQSCPLETLAGAAIFLHVDSLLVLFLYTTEESFTAERLFESFSLAVSLTVTFCLSINNQHRLRGSVIAASNKSCLFGRLLEFGGRHKYPVTSHVIGLLSLGFLRTMHKNSHPLPSCNANITNQTSQALQSKGTECMADSNDSKLCVP